MIVKPTAPGTVIRDPHTRRPLPDDGAAVPDTNYWRRRLLDGDVEIVKPAEAVEVAEREAAPENESKRDTKPAKRSKRGAKGPTA